MLSYVLRSLRPRPKSFRLYSSHRKTSVRDVIKTGYVSDQVTVQGWIRSIRNQKNNVFLDINDGSSLANLQIVISSDKFKEYVYLYLACEMSTNSKIRLNLSQGASISAQGALSSGRNSVELVDPVVIKVGDCDPTYPLQKKRHSFEYLRDIAHLRSRGNTIGAVMRLRNTATMAVHNFFQKEGFILVHTPILNSNDCEGAGELFFVNTKDDVGSTSNKFFNVDQCFLTVSGQLEAEIFATSMSKVYTFGPTFRAENSHTPRHLSEFWMVEPEIAFCDLDGVMDVAERFLQSCVHSVLDQSMDDLKFFNQHIDTTLLSRLEKDNKESYGRMTYTEAIEILQKNGFQIQWGEDLSREYERYLCETYANKPVFVTNYPKDIKPFYMHMNEDGKTVDCMDLLFPKIGEMIGGSQREDRLDVLMKRMRDMNINPNSLDWYLDLRRYGSVHHGGFGLGFERFILYISGMENIRDVIPIPRYPNYCKF